MKEKNRKKENRILLITICLIVIIILMGLVIDKLPENFRLLYLLIIYAAGIMIVFSINIIGKRRLKMYSMKSHVDSKDKTIHDYDEIINKYLPEIGGEKALLEDLYQRFIQVEEALSDGDLDTLKKICVDSLYESLANQYESYASKEEIHAINDFSLYAFNIQNVSLDNQTISIKMTLHVSFFDYVTDMKGKYLRGNDEAAKHEQFVLDFVVDKDKNIICPNCGAHVSSRTCDYCKTVFKDVYYDFSLANIGLFKNSQDMY